MITSSNADFNENGFAALVRDMERAYLLLSELGVEAGDSNVSTTLRFDGGGQFPASNYWVGPSEGPYNTLTVNNTVIGGDTTRGLAGADGVNGQNGTNGTNGFPPESISGDGSFINIDNSVFSVTAGDNVFFQDAVGNTINPGQEAGIGVGTKLKVTAVTPPPYVFPTEFQYTRDWTSWFGYSNINKIGLSSDLDAAIDYQNGSHNGGIYSRRQFGAHVNTTQIGGGSYYFEGTAIRARTSIGSTSNATDNGHMFGYMTADLVNTYQVIPAYTITSATQNVTCGIVISPIYGFNQYNPGSSSGNGVGEAYFSTNGISFGNVTSGSIYQNKIGPLFGTNEQGLLIDNIGAYGPIYQSVYAMTIKIGDRPQYYVGKDDTGRIQGITELPGFYYKYDSSYAPTNDVLIDASLTGGFIRIQTRQLIYGYGGGQQSLAIVAEDASTYVDFILGGNSAYNNRINVLNTGGDILMANGTRVVSVRQAAVTDATGTLASATSQLNALLARLRTHGLIS